MRDLPPRYISLFTLKYFLVISTIYSTACDSEVILKELGQTLSFSVKSEVSTSVEPPHIRN